MTDRKNPAILVTFPATPAQRERILAAASGCQVDFCAAQDVTEQQLAQAEIEFGNLPPEVLRRADRLQWLQLNSAGADAYTAPGALRAGVALTSAVGAYGLAVSEHMVAMVMAMNRRFPQYVRNQGACLWRPEGEVRSVEGSVILTLGLGNIGGDFARKMKALGAYTLGIRRKAGECPDYVDEMYTLDQLDGLLPRADVVAISLPLTPETKGLFDARRLGLMKQGALLLNIGRGKSVDTQALIDSLTSGHLGGACLDVTDPEPLPADHPLWKAPNLFLTPHVAGQFFLPETKNRIVAIFCENLALYRKGQPLRNLTAH